MYEYIKGEITSAGADYAVIETGGIGYQVFTTAQSLLSLKVGQQTMLYCRFVVREDAQTLYGFVTPEEKEMFIKLTGVSGIGPKAALSLLSAMKVSELAAAIITANENALTKVTGIGKKTAQRIIIDLSEKIHTAEVLEIEATQGAGKEAETVGALVSLGYNRAEAVSAVSCVCSLADTTEELVLLALKRMGK